MECQSNLHPDISYLSVNSTGFDQWFITFLHWIYDIQFDLNKEKKTWQSNITVVLGLSLSMTPKIMAKIAQSTTALVMVQNKKLFVNRSA